MDNKMFADEVYKKYEYYKNVKDDEFFNRHQYRVGSWSAVLSKVAVLLVVSVFAVGFVYAASHYKERVWKQPEVVNYSDEREVTPEDVENSISEDEAKSIGIRKLEGLNLNVGNVTESYLNKVSSANRIEWVIATDTGLEIRINAKNGDIYSYWDDNLWNKVSDSKVSEEEAVSVAKEIFEGLEYSKDYEFSYISYVDNGKWQADFCVEYDGIFNPYECVRVTFVPETKEIAMLNVFDYEFENNAYEISEEQAIDIVKEKCGEDKIVSIAAKRDIQKMNAIVYQRDNPVQNGEYRVDDVVRNVWNVEVKDSVHGFRENYFVDATTGEIIGGDQVK